MKVGDLVREEKEKKIGLLIQKNIIISHSLIKWDVFILGNIYDLYDYQLTLVHAS